MNPRVPRMYRVSNHVLNPLLSIRSARTALSRACVERTEEKYGMAYTS
jgi:hypothetical protein